MTSIRTALASIRDRQDAQDRYYSLDRHAGRVFAMLAREDDPRPRALLLDQLAADEQDMANLHAEAFGPDPIPHEGGRDLAKSLASSARLVRMIAGTEHMLAHQRLPEGFMDEFLGFTEMRQHVLTGLFHTRDRDLRADMIDLFYEAVVDDVGGQAAEVLGSLAHTERECAAGPSPLRRALRAAGPLVESLVAFAGCGTIALLAGGLVIRLGHGTPGMPVAAAFFAIAVFVALTETGAWFEDRRKARRCAACGHPARTGDRLRFYRIERRYPQPRRHTVIAWIQLARFVPAWASDALWHAGDLAGRLPRYEMLRCHRSHLTDPASGLYRRRRFLRGSNG